MPRHIRTCLIALTPVIGLLAACGGGGGTDGGTSGRDDTYEFASRSCDPLRGEGTITNRAGEPAAFRVTVSYEYGSGETRPQSRTETPVLADGESHDFAAGPDPSGSAPSGCSIVTAERIDVDASDAEAVEEREGAAPDGEPGQEQVEPVWSVDDIDGSVSAVAMDDGVVFIASDLPSGSAVFGVDADDGTPLWRSEVDLRFGLLEPDGDGGVLAVSGDMILAFDDAGEVRWDSRPLNRPGGSLHGSVDRLAVSADLIVASGTGPGSMAGIDPESGEQLWYVHQDEASASERIGFGGGDVHLSITDHGVLVAGGSPSLRHITLFDISGAEPEVAWAHEGASQVTSDGEVVIDAADSTVTAYDLATGDELWSETDDAWDGAPPGQPAIIDGVAIVQRARSTVGFDLRTGEQLWADEDISVVTGPIGTSGVEVGDRVLGALSTVEYLLIGADGSTIQLDLDLDARGTILGIEAEEGKVLVAARGSTSSQPSSAWLLDLTDLA